MSKNRWPFDPRPVSPISPTCYNTPTLGTMMHRGARPRKITTKRSKATPLVAAATLVQAFKVTILITLIAPTSVCTHIIF